MPPQPPHDDRRTNRVNPWRVDARGTPEAFDYEASAETIVDEEEAALASIEVRRIEPRNVSSRESEDRVRAMRLRNVS